MYDNVPCTADRRIFDAQGNIQESQILDLLKEKYKVREKNSTWSVIVIFVVAKFKLFLTE